MATMLLLACEGFLIINYRACLSACPDDSLAEHRIFSIIYDVRQPSGGAGWGGGGWTLISHEELKP